MKSKLLQLNIGLILFLAGILFSLSSKIQTGAISILMGSGLIAGIYLQVIWKAIREKKPVTSISLLCGAILFVLAILFVHGFSISLDTMLFAKLNWFTSLYFAAGIVLIVLFFYFNVIAAQEEHRAWLIGGVTISSLMAILGLLGYARWFPTSPRLVFYGWVFLIFFFLIFLSVNLLKGQTSDKKEYRQFLALTLAIIGFWLFRFALGPMQQQGLMKAIIDYGFVPLLVLPMSILIVKRFYAFVIFAFYFVCLDFYFIHFDDNVDYLVNVGINGCENYEQEAIYNIQEEPGISMQELVANPSKEEIDQVFEEWHQKSFAVIDPQVVYEERRSNGDSILVIAHQVDGNTHYGAVRIPVGIDPKHALLLLELEGGGGGIDVSEESTITNNKCSSARAKFISILPSYRGNILRGNHYCFRSDGYFGDAWHGAAIDAITLLEVVKTRYQKPHDTPVLVYGLSRGATVALIIGSLTDKVDYIVANSTHTKFLDAYVFENELVAGSFGRTFYTPKTTSDNIRKRMIASSPYFFADRLPPFQLHQGTQDQFTTIWHARQLKGQIEKLGMSPSDHQFFLYEGKGHGYDDDKVVCEAFERFLQDFK